MRNPLSGGTLRSMTRRAAFIMPAVCAASLALAACGPASTNVAVPSSADVPDDQVDIDKARAENQSNFYAEKFADQVVVLDDLTGVQATRLFFEDSETLVVSDGLQSSQLRAASIAVAQHAPMVVFDGENRGDIASLVADLGVKRVLLVGDVPIAAQTGAVTVTEDPGSKRALGVLTAFQFESKVVAAPERMVDAVAGLNPDEKTELKAAWEPLTVDEEADADDLKALPAQSRRDADQAPVVIAAPESPLAAVATVRAYGGNVRVLPTSDPRDSKAAYAMVAGLEDGPLVALGPVFETPDELRAKILDGWTQ